MRSYKTALLQNGALTKRPKLQSIYLNCSNNRSNPMGANKVQLIMTQHLNFN